MNSMGGYGNGMMGAGGMLLGLIFMVLLWAAVILLIIWLYKQIKGPSVPPAHESALEILKRRYAAGEITREEFEERKKDLM